MDCVQELEHYLSKNTLDQVVKEMMVDSLKAKPDDPLPFLLKWILNRNANKESEDVAVATNSTPATDSVPAKQLHVAVSHSDAKTQQYLTDKKIHHILLEILKQVVDKQPENPLGFIAIQAHDLHKAPPASLKPT